MGALPRRSMLRVGILSNEKAAPGPGAAFDLLYVLLGGRRRPVVRK